MQFKQIEDIIGTEVSYNDYLGLLRNGRIGWIEEYNGIQDDPDHMIVWVYIVDDDPEYNVHEFIFNDGQQMRSFMYAEMRLSTEVFLIE